MADRGWREVFRDRWILVVDKDSGLPTQRTATGEPGLVDLLARKERVFLHHRLDRPASGLLVLALHEAANARLAEGFRRHTIRRTYGAVLYGTARTETWSVPLDGQAATSAVHVLGSAAGFTAVRLTLHTGRTHQLRRHAALAGVPIAGDRRYGGDAGHAWPRLALHAAHLALHHPVTHEPLAWSSPIPDDLRPLWTLAGGPADVVDSDSPGP